MAFPPIDATVASNCVARNTDSDPKNRFQFRHFWKKRPTLIPRQVWFKPNLTYPTLV
jgi:hypothetical protein